MRVHLLSAHPSSAASLEPLVRQHSRVTSFAANVVEAAHWAATARDMLAVDVLILDDLIAQTADVTELQALVKRNPDQLILLLWRDGQTQLLIEAMDAGVAEVVRWPARPEDFLHALQKCDQKHYGYDGKVSHARLIAVVPCKGGSGATFVATNLAYALATEFNRKTLLIDLDLQYGDASFAMTEVLNPLNVVTVAGQEADDDAYLMAACFPLGKNLFLLQSPADVEQAARLKPDQLERLLRQCERLFDVVVLDLDKKIDPLFMKALDHANDILQIMQAQIPDLRNLHKQSHFLNQLGYPSQKMHVVLNRAGLFGDLERRVENELKGRNYFRIPDDAGKALLAGTTGEPILLLAPRSPASRALIALAASLLAVPVAEPGLLERVREFIFEP
jgi:pilus assembly protein CpaE